MDYGRAALTEMLCFTMKQKNPKVWTPVLSYVLYTLDNSQ